MTDHSSDPTLLRFREEIAGLDRTILDAVNTRLELVAELKRYKASRGMPFVDAERERVLLEELTAANQGPLSAEGLERLVSEILDLTKREVSRDGT